MQELSSLTKSLKKSPKWLWRGKLLYFGESFNKMLESWFGGNSEWWGVIVILNPDHLDTTLYDRLFHMSKLSKDFLIWIWCIANE